MIVDDSKKSPKVAKKFCCEICYYITSKKSDFVKHLSTDKHKKSDNGSKMVVNDSKKSPKVAEYKCVCGKFYRYDSGYYRHKKNCNLENINNNEIMALTNLVVDVVKQNQELTNKIFDICKNNVATNIQNTINSNNKTFNLNVFLNEHCKDAMNIMDFVDSLKIQLSDLENVGKVGYVNGISDIIIKNLKALDIHKRPVHCSDSKREVMYIKDENKWEKENEEKVKLRKVIKYIAHKNSKMIPIFKEKYPDCGKSESKHSDQYNKLIIEAMGGPGDNDFEKEDKIIKKIAKEVSIDKI
jgi:hypothetical protein